jgi:peptidoglycan/LPS O-acetylase OafA/YrhL
MDKENYYQKRAREMQREISQELATRQLLKDARHEPLTAKQARRRVLRLVPALIVLTALLLLILLI